jgi:hypothetical protein
MRHGRRSEVTYMERFPRAWIVAAYSGAVYPTAPAYRETVPERAS